MKRIIQLLLLVLLFCGITNAQEYKAIMSKTFSNFNKISVVNDSVYLDGYLVFRILKEKDEQDITNIRFLKCDIYFIEYLYEIESIEKWVFYNSYQLDYKFYLSFNDYKYFESPSSENIIRFNKLLDNYYLLTSDTNNCCIIPRMFNTSIFLDSNLYFVNKSSDLNKSYFIIPAKFKAGIIKNNCTYFGKLYIGDSEEEHTMKDVRMFYPLSKNYKKDYISLNFLENNGFKLSNWKCEDILIK